MNMQKNDQKPQNHGKTQAEMKELQIKQVNENTEMVAANKDSSYQIPAHNDHLIHAMLKMPGFNPQTGAPLHRPFHQSFTKKIWDHMIRTGGFKGYNVTVIHNPEGAEAISETEVGGNTSTHTTEEKSLSRMNKAELIAKYTVLYGEEPAPELKVDELRTAIEEKIAFNDKEGEGGDGF